MSELRLCSCCNRKGSSRRGRPSRGQTNQDQDKFTLISMTISFPSTFTTGYIDCHQMDIFSHFSAEQQHNAQRTTSSIRMRVSRIWHHMLHQVSNSACVRPSCVRLVFEPPMRAPATVRTVIAQRKRYNKAHGP